MISMVFDVLIYEQLHAARYILFCTNSCNAGTMLDYSGFREFYFCKSGVLLHIAQSYIAHKCKLSLYQWVD